MTVQDRIYQALQDRFHPTHLDLVDESDSHAGHAGARQTGGGHYAVCIVSDAFQNQSLLERHQAVYQALEPFLQTDIHALRIKAATRAEWKS